MFPSDKIRKIENTHILLWLLKDISWLMIWETLGIIMIVPTVGVAVYLTYQARADLKELSFNLAVLCWILANSIWMIGEFFFDDGTRPIALVFFVLGLCSIGFYYSKFYFFKRKVQ